VNKGHLSAADIKATHKQVAVTLTATLSDLAEVARRLRVIGGELPQDTLAAAGALTDAAIGLHVALEAYTKDRYPGEDWVKVYDIQLLDFQEIEPLEGGAQ